jgi:hypothetical protein
MKYDLKIEYKAYWNIYFFNFPSMEHIADSSVQFEGIFMYQYNFHMLVTHYEKLSV